MGQGDDNVRIWGCPCNQTFYSYEDRHAHKCPPTKDEQFVKELNDLVADVGVGFSHEAAVVLDELKAILKKYDKYEELLVCGCVASEFGCQGYHGV